MIGPRPCAYACALMLVPVTPTRRRADRREPWERGWVMFTTNYGMRDLLHER